MIGAQCKMARAAFGYSAAQLADLAGVGRMTVVRFEDGKNVDPESAKAIAVALRNAGAKFSETAGRISVSVPR